jgi:hypothetical protein
MVLQLQIALTAARKENLQLRLQLQGRGVEAVESAGAMQQLGNPRGYIQSRFTKATQTALFGQQLDALLAPASPPPRNVKFAGEHTAITATAPPPRSASPMDSIDEYLEERRSKKLERVLLERTLKLGDTETHVFQLEEEVALLRSAMQQRDTVKDQLRADIARRDDEITRLKDELLVAQRDAEAGVAARRQEGVLQLEMATLASTLAAKEAETVEVHGLCDYLHGQVGQLRSELDMQLLIGEEKSARRAVIADGDAWFEQSLHLFFVQRSGLQSVSHRKQLERRARVLAEDI